MKAILTLEGSCTRSYVVSLALPQAFLDKFGANCDQQVFGEPLMPRWGESSGTASGSRERYEKFRALPEAEERVALLREALAAAIAAPHVEVDRIFEIDL
jgi:hypothetical protein